MTIDYSVQNWSKVTDTDVVLSTLIKTEKSTKWTNALLLEKASKNRNKGQQKHRNSHQSFLRPFSKGHAAAQGKLTRTYNYLPLLLWVSVSKEPLSETPFRKDGRRLRPSFRQLGNSLRRGHKRPQLTTEGSKCSVFLYYGQLCFP